MRRVRCRVRTRRCSVCVAMMSEDTDGDVQTQRTQIEKAMRWDPVDNFDPYGTETTYYLSWHFTISPCFDCPLSRATLSVHRNWMRNAD